MVAPARLSSADDAPVLDGWAQAQAREAAWVIAVVQVATLAGGAVTGWVQFTPGIPVNIGALVWSLATLGWVVLTWAFLADRLPGHVIGLRVRGYVTFAAGLVAGGLAALLW